MSTKQEPSLVERLEAAAKKPGTVTVDLLREAAAALRATTGECWQHRPGAPCPTPQSCRENGCSAIEREQYAATTDEGEWDWSVDWLGNQTAPRPPLRDARALDGLLQNLEHEAGDVDDAPPSIDENEDAYWAYLGYHAIKRLQEAARAVREAVPGWQPIETAPKDGTFVLLSALDVPVWQGSWVEKSGRYEINGWTRFNSIDMAWRPTHWMPLPAAPTQDQENG